jgi:hypothetical protein
MTDFRAELQALVTAYDNHGGRWPQHHEDALSGAVERARFALKADRPGTRLAVHPDGTPMASIGEAADLDAIARLAADPEHARAELAEPEPPAKGEVTDEDLDAMWNTEAEYFALYSEARRFARAILARFGGHHAPVPVSERLPGPEDCLDEGWAWFFSPRVGWRQAVLPVSPAFTHWLPAHALPLPTD